MNILTPARKAGEFVVYKKHGIYEISEIRAEKIAGEAKTYYVLKSVYDANVTVYVPADKEELTSQMESPLTKAEIEGIVEKSKGTEIELPEVNSERFAFCEEIIAQGDLSKILALLLLLKKSKEEALLQKRKLFAHDERMLAASQNIIREAFAFPLGMDKKNVIDCVTANLAE
ncbi:MAG: hypothetical protein IJD93_07755 [Ruminococcus sp.]|nr:hypothetical protein [Ruminococcus sp.]